MKLKDLNVGTLDAKYQLLNDSTESRKLFIESYVFPPRFNIESFISGKKYFILGLKGTGKTALLRYISIKKEEINLKEYSEFILFKTEFNDEDRKNLSRLSNININMIEDKNLDSFNNDDSSKSAWKYLIYRTIVDFQNRKNINIFQRNKTWDKFCNLVLSENKEKKSIFPTLKRGKMTISKSPSIQTEFDWNAQGEYVIDFNEYIKKIGDLFKGLDAGEDSLSIYFDELELSNNKNKEYLRDINLIKNIIFVIEELNSICSRQYFPIKIYGAIRSEVKLSINSSGFEVNKPLSEFGIELIWHKASTEDENQPILSVISKRLRYQLSTINTDDELWNSLFPKTIQNESTKKYILHNSWYRPRDVVRMLKLAQDENPDADSFTHQIFDSIRKKYSEDSWVELREELRTKYKPEEVQSIERIFNGFKSEFTLKEFYTHVSETKELYDHEVKIPDEPQKLKSILTDLYNVGFLGNKYEGKIFKFSFRGDQMIDLKSKFYIHPAMRKFFNIY